ncbi:hypothetical protein [Stomatobaculum longum]|uniref:hypothetical protein n=1 Tax=Stomatobaculum longum TaxID=796942 RepID=UPI0028D46122|nr:hypothetical protein [Stomatobaculum longum]
MKETVIYDSRTGDVLAVTSERDTEHIEAKVFEVQDGERVDRVDVSGEEHKAVTSATPASLEVQVLANKEAIAAQDKKLLDAINVLMGGEE